MRELMAAAALQASETPTTDAALMAKVATLEEQVKEIDERCTRWVEYANSLKPKADAWDAHEDYWSTYRMIDVLGWPCQCGRKTFMQKMSGIASLIGITVQPTDTYSEIRKRVLLKSHPDKRRCTVDLIVLYEKVYLAATTLPARWI